MLETLSSRNKLSICLLLSLTGLFVVTYESSFYSFQISSPPGTLVSLLKDQAKSPIINGVTDFSGASNSTLGVSNHARSCTDQTILLTQHQFESILVVSPNKSLGGETIWRQEGMHRAANLTGLTIHIPSQPNFPLSLDSTPWLTTVLKAKIEEDTGEDGKLHNGQLMSRLGHLNVLHGMLDANISTAIIMENDGDWGVEIKSQTPAIASAIRNLTHANNIDTNPHPWGMNYDLLALGHCGASRASPFLVINDSTALPPALYSKLRDPGHDVPEHGRLVYETNGAVCTYAYAVTRKGAEKLIANMEDRDGPWDLLVADQCSNNEDFWCGAVTPEVFHHQRW